MTITVEAAFGFAPTASSVTWTDITQWVTLNETDKIRITRGASDELSQTQVGTLGLTLDNRDGRFTAGNAASPYYPYVRPGCPIRVRRDVGALGFYRFYGMVTDWNQEWHGLEDEVRIAASDLFALLSGDEALQALLVEEVLQLGPLAYYPLSEPSGSTSAGDIAGAGAGSLSVTQLGSGGSLEFGEGTGPGADGLAAPMFTPASATAGKYLSGDLGQQAADATAQYFMYMESWFSTSTKGRVLFGLRSDTSQYKIVFSLDGTTGELKIEWTTFGDAIGGYASTIISTGDLADGNQHHVVYIELTSQFYVDGVEVLGAAPQAMRYLRHLSIGSFDSGRLWSGVISHVSIYAQSATIPATRFIDHYTAGATGFSGEDADDRVLRLAGYAGIGAVDPSGDFSPVASQGEGGSTALEMMRQVEATEGGKLLCDRGFANLRFQARSVRYNTVPALSIAYADLETHDVKSTIDTQKLTNTVTASRPGGATQRVASASSRLAYGPKRQELTLLKMSDGEVLDAAWWTVSRYAEPQPEIRQVSVEAYTMPEATFQTLLDVDVSTVLAITGMPATAPSPTATVTVEGYVETIGQSSHRLDFYTSRTNTDSVWVLDDSTHSVLGSTTRLAY
ncbi:hypothetical protein ABZ135_36515 [Streptomyces sp. NPDC006339]|uniref:hypothetical protein n=1 Tax=Streptomyces sp. NPDC006339 TaxID=3156755 RepID=UPI0033AB8B43